VKIMKTSVTVTLITAKMEASVIFILVVNAQRDSLVNVVKNKRSLVWKRFSLVMVTDAVCLSKDVSVTKASLVKPVIVRNRISALLKLLSV